MSVKLSAVAAPAAAPTLSPIGEKLTREGLPALTLAKRADGSLVLARVIVKAAREASGEKPAQPASESLKPTALLADWGAALAGGLIEP